MFAFSNVETKLAAGWIYDCAFVRLLATDPNISFKEFKHHVDTMARSVIGSTIASEHNELIADEFIEKIEYEQVKEFIKYDE